MQKRGSLENDELFNNTHKPCGGACRECRMAQNDSEPLCIVFCSASLASVGQLEGHEVTFSLNFEARNDPVVMASSQNPQDFEYFTRTHGYVHYDEEKYSFVQLLKVGMRDVLGSCGGPL